MVLDPRAIVKKDFRISRRGYEPEAVDTHLAEVAREVDRLQSELTQAETVAAARGTAASGTLADAASRHVRAIIEAAEHSAAAILRGAEEDAERLRATALSRSEEHVSSVGEATGHLRGRVEEIERELAELLVGLRAGVDRLDSPSGATMSAAAVVTPGPAGEPSEQPAATPGPADELSERSSDVPARTVAPEAEPVLRGGSADVEGARLIALNMALDGRSREETDAYLRGTFDLPDHDGLLDEVYATVAG